MWIWDLLARSGWLLGKTYFQSKANQLSAYNLEPGSLPSKEVHQFSWQCRMCGILGALWWKPNFLSVTAFFCYTTHALLLIRVCHYDVVYKFKSPVWKVCIIWKSCGWKSVLFWKTLAQLDLLQSNAKLTQLSPHYSIRALLFFRTPVWHLVVQA